MTLITYNMQAKPFHVLHGIQSVRTCTCDDVIAKHFGRGAR